MAEVESTMIQHLLRMMCKRIHTTARDLAMYQPYNNPRSFEKYFHDYFLQYLIEQPDNSCNSLISFSPATEASM